MRVLSGVLGLLRCSAHLQTCREPQRRSSGPFNPPIRPAPFPSPVPPCFSLNPGWHHHGGTHGPPHLLPITSRQKPSTKETPNGYEMERNNLGPWENISETSRASSQSGRGVDPRVIIWCDPGSRGLGRCVKHFLDVKYAWAEKTKFSAIWKGANMRLFAALGEHMWEDALILNPTFAELNTLDDTKSKKEWKDEARTLSLPLLFVVQRLFFFIFLILTDLCGAIFKKRLYEVGGGRFVFHAPTFRVIKICLIPD